MFKLVGYGILLMNVSTVIAFSYYSKIAKITDSQTKNRNALLISGMKPDESTESFLSGHFTDAVIKKIKILPIKQEGTIPLMAILVFFETEEQAKKAKKSFGKKNPGSD